MFGLFIPLVTIAIALTFAILITVGGSGKGQVRGVRGAGFYRVVSLFPPYVIPAIAVGIMWRLILDPSNGLVNGGPHRPGGSIASSRSPGWGTWAPRCR